MDGSDALKVIVGMSQRVPSAQSKRSVGGVKA